MNDTRSTIEWAYTPREQIEQHQEQKKARAEFFYLNKWMMCDKQSGRSVVRVEFPCLLSIVLIMYNILKSIFKWFQWDRKILTF